MKETLTTYREGYPELRSQMALPVCESTALPAASTLPLATIVIFGPVLGSQGLSQTNSPIDPSKASISIQQAWDIALGEVSGTVTEIELENERGVLVYDVEVASATGEVELQIDAASGQILAKKLDDDKHDDDDDRGDKDD